MKKFLLKFLFTILFIGVLNNVYAGTYVAKATGSWKDATNWSGPVANHIPTFGDIAIIPSNVIITYSVVNTAGNLSLGYEPWDNPTIYVFGQLKLHADAAVVSSTTESEGPFLDNNLAKILFFSGSTLTDDTYAGLIFTATNSFYFYTGSHFVVGPTNAFGSTIFQYDNDGPDVDDPSNVEFVNRSGPFTVTPTREGVADAVSNTEPPAVAPAVSTPAASGIGTSSATLNGEVFSTAVQTTGIIFDYSTASDLSGALTATASATSVALNSSNQTITANLTGLVSGQTYYYRIEGTNTTGTTLGDIQTFTIPCTPPTVTGNPPNRTTCNGGATTFSVSGTNVTAYKWQVNSGAGFTDLSDGGSYSGTATATLHVSPATGSMSGFTYRARLINGVGTCTVNSNAATLTVDVVSVITNGITNVSCFGGNNGAATVLVTSGIGPFIYSWSPSGGTGSSATGLAAGTYTVFVTDNIGCTGQVTVVVGQPSAPVSGTASLNNNVTMHGGGNGSVTVAASGGTPGYTYAWSPSGGNGTTASGLVAGTYKVLITDINSCTSFSNNITVFEPTATPTASAISGTGFTATWAAETGATSYRLDVSADGFNTFVSGYNDLSVSGTSQAITGLTAGTTYSYRVRYVNSGGTSPNSATSTQVANTPPTIAGTVSQQGVNDNTTISPFNSVIINDAETSQTQTVTVSLDDAAKGSFTTLNGFTNAGGGTYTFSGTAAAAQTAIRGLVFTPTPNRTPHGGTETTTFTIAVNDGIAATVTDNSTSVISISVNDKPVIAGINTLTYNALNAATAVSPGLTVTDPEDNSMASASVTITSGFVLGDILAANTAGTNISVVYTPGTGVLTLSGSDPIGHYQQVLQSVSYSNASRNPSANGTNTSRQIDYTVSDGGLQSDVVSSTINITASSDATLSALVLSSGTLSPAFGSGTTTYTASTTATSITVTPTKTDADATLQIQLNGGGYTGIASGTASSDLSLATGTNTIDLKLVAPDGTVKTYTTTITRKIQPIITMQPATGSQAVFVDGAPAPLTVAASGGTGFTYQWYSNTTASNTGGTPISLPIGTSYAGAGGKVGYILQPGDPGYVAGQISGIIVAPTDAGDGAEWGCQGTSVGTSFNIGSGLANTNAMISSCSTPGTAARLARAYSANGFNDWFLPSYNEMNQFYINRAAIGGFANSGYYWTSSQFNGSEAYGAGFDNGDNGLGHGTKSDGDRVRAARYFNIADTFAPLSATAGTTYYYVVVTNSDGLSVTSDVSGSVAVSLQPTLTATSFIGQLGNEYGTATGGTSFDVGGSNLLSDVTVTAPAGFEISTSTAGTFTNSLTLPQSSGTVGLTALYLRLAAADNVGTYSGDILVMATGATTLHIATIASTVTPKNITVTADAQTKVYGDADPALTYQITSGALANGDVFAGTLTRDGGENANTYAITQGTLALNANYIINYTSDNLTINPATLTVTADPQSKAYGTADPTLTYTTIGLISTTVDGVTINDGANDVLSGTLTRDAGEQPGTYAISQGSLTSTGNYTIAFNAENLTITPTVANEAELSNLLTSVGTINQISSTAYTVTLSGLTIATLRLKAIATDPLATLTINGNPAASNVTTADITLNTGTTPTIIPIVILAEDGVATKTIQVTVNRIASANADLSNLAVSGQTPTQVSSTEYTATVTGSQVVVRAATADAGATLKINGTPVAPNTYTGNISLTTGANTIPIVVTAEDGTMKTYTLTVTKLPSTINDLKSLALGGGIVPTQTTATTFTASVNASTVTVRATADASATIKINGATVASGQYSGNINLVLGDNAIPMVITAEDGTPKTYTLTVTRLPSTNNDLKGLAVSGQTPTQTSATTFTASIVGTTTTVRATTADANATVMIDGTTVVSGTYSNPINLTLGANTITTVITAEDGTPKTYTLTVTRLPSTNNDLKSLAVSGQTPTQTTATTYAVTVTATTATVRAITADANATIMINGTTVASGSYSNTISLTTGSNTVTTVVTAEDGTPKTYTLTITRIPSSNAGLKSLALNGGVMVTQTSPTDYTATVMATSVLVRATVADARATLKINGVATASGLYSGSIPLITGSNTVTVLVTAEDGTPQTYTLTITRMPSNNASLKSLAIGGGITPTQTDAISYTASVTTATVTVRTIVVDAGATVKINGTAVASGSYSNPISLTTGANTITILITAEDGTTKTYTLTVTTTATTSFAAIPVTGDETLNIPPPSAIIPANILSPNGDGKNDTWIVKDIDYYPNNTVTIYDHAGKVVYRKKGYSNEWDGSTGNGAPLPQGTYYYILKLSPDITAIKGFISILRNN